MERREQSRYEQRGERNIGLELEPPFLDQVGPRITSLYHFVENTC